MVSHFKQNEKFIKEGSGESGAERSGEDRVRADMISLEWGE